MDKCKLYSVEAELNLLGSLIVDNDKFIEIPDLIAADFYEDRNRILFTGMKSLYSKGTKFDEVVLYTALKTELENAGGITYIMSLAGAVVSTLMVKEYANIIKDYALKRDILKLSQDIEKNIEKKPTNEIAASLEQEFNKINNKNIKDTGEINQSLVDIINTAEQRYKTGGGIVGIPTGYRKIDEGINGLNKGDLIIIAARPSMGKTTLVLNMFLNTSIKFYKAVSFFSLEMTRSQLLTKAISNLSLIKHNKIINGAMDQEEFTRMTNTAGKLNNIKNMRIYDLISNIQGIKAECKKLKMQNNLDAIIIDYLQLIKTNERFKNRTDEVSYISSELKLIAKELNVPVIVLSQLSRAPEGRATHEPILSDLRESGSIEQDADIVMMLYRDEYYNPKTEKKNIIDIFINKNRNGEVGKLKLVWKPEYSKVTECYNS